MKGGLTHGSVMTMSWKMFEKVGRGGVEMCWANEAVGGLQKLRTSSLFMLAGANLHSECVASFGGIC